MVHSLNFFGPLINTSYVDKASAHLIFFETIKAWKYKPQFAHFGFSKHLCNMAMLRRPKYGPALAPHPAQMLFTRSQGMKFAVNERNI